MDDLRQIEDKPYYVTPDGRVWSERSKKFLKPAKTHGGYLFVHLWEKNKGEMRFVHRLVAEAFIANPEQKEQVNHVDGDKTNNAVENLEWATRSENQLHRYNVLNIRGHNPSTREANKSRMKRVRCVETGAVYDSVREAAESVGGKQSGLSSCLVGANKTYKGRHWEYA